MSLISRYVVPAQLTSEVPYHGTAQIIQCTGPSYTYMEKALLPESDIRLDVRQVIRIPSNYSLDVEPHKHPVNQVYGIGKGLTCEVVMEDEKQDISGPVGIFIPAGIMHTLCLRRGRGYLVVVTSGGQYI
jgi:hypothetical protein